MKPARIIVTSWDRKPVLGGWRGVDLSRSGPPNEWERCWPVPCSRFVMRVRRFR